MMCISTEGTGRRKGSPQNRIVGPAVTDDDHPSFANTVGRLCGHSRKVEWIRISRLEERVPSQCVLKPQIVRLNFATIIK